MKKILSVAIVVVMIAALCATAFAVEDYGAAISSTWVKTNHVSRDEIRNGDDTGKYVCGSDPAQTYDVTFPTGQTACIFWGWVAADETITGYGYTVNNGEMVTDPLFFVEAEPGVVTHVAAAGLGPASARMKIKAALTEGTQMIRCYVFYGTVAELIWQTKVVVGDSEGAAAKHGSSVDAFKGIKGETATALSPSTLTGIFDAGAFDGLEIIGWYGANIAMDAVGYKIDDGEPVFSGNMSAVPDDDPVRAAGNGGPKAMRVDITADVSGLTDGLHTVAYVARLADASVITMFTATAKVGYDGDYKIMKDDSGFDVGYWLGDMLDAGAYVEFDFTTPNAFSGFNTIIFATAAANGGCKAAVQLLKDGVLVESVELQCKGDSWQSGNFSKSYPAGTYSARLVKVDGGSGKYVVLGEATPDAAKYVKVTVVGNSSHADMVPYLTLLGGSRNATEAFETANAAMSSFDSIYVNIDHWNGTPTPSKDVTIDIGETINLLGWVWPGEGVAVNDVYYTVDDGKYVLAERALRPRGDVDTAIGKAGSTGIGLDDNCLTLTGVSNQLPGEYTVKVFAFGDNGTMYYMLTINLTINNPEILDPTRKGIDRVYINTDSLADAGVAATDDFLYDVEIKPGDKLSLLGTLYAGEGVKVIGAVYSVDGVFYNTDNQLRDRPDVDGAWGVSGAKGLGLDANCLTLNGIEDLGRGEYEVKVYGVGDDGKYYNILTVNLTVEPTFGDADAKSVDRVYVNHDTVAFDDTNIAETQGVYNVTMDKGGMITTAGWILVPSGMKQIVYSVDGGSFVVGENVYRDRPDAGASHSTGGTHAGVGVDANCLDLLGVNELAAGTYEIAVYAEGNNGIYYKYADIALTVNRTAPEANKIGSSVDFVKAYLGDEDKGDFTGASFEHGAYNALKCIGWYGANYEIAQFGYKLNDGAIVYGDWAADAEDPVLAAGGRYAKRFTIPADISSLGAGEFSVTFVVKLADEDNTVMEIETVEGTITVVAEKVGSYVDAVKALLDDEDKGAFESAPFELGTYDAIKADGWFGANLPVVHFGYRINDGEPVFGDWAEDVAQGDPVRAPANGGDLAKRFHIPADISALEAGEFVITYVVELEDGTVLDITDVEGTIEPTEVTPPATGSVTAIIVTAAVLAIGAAVVIGKKRIAE